MQGVDRERGGMLTVSLGSARYGIAVMVLVLGLGIPAYSKPVEIKSPNRDIVVSLDTSAAGGLTYSVRFRGKTAVAPSALGVLVDDKNLGQNVSLGRPTTRRFEGNYATRGVHSMASNKYQEAIFPVTGGAVPTNWNLEVRVFDDGVAYRYRVAGQTPHRIAGESSEWKLPPGSMLWYQSDKNKDYEAPFVQGSVEELTVGSTIAAPATAKLPGETGYVMMTEANQIQYSDMTLEVSGPQTFKAIFPNNRQGWTAPGEVVSPWRVTVVTRDLNGLVNTDILHNLCPPPAPELLKADWIQPGRTTWHWMVTGPPQLEQQRQWVDQTKQLGFEYYLIDDGWKRWKDGDKDAWTCLKEIVSYATSQNVRIFAWVNSDELQTESARIAYFERANAAGLVGLKIDFPHPADTEWVQWYDDTLRDTARYKLMVNFHGAVKPTGRERTWPHELTREGIRGRENYKQTGLHDTTLPFVRYVQGHADFTPAELRLDKLGSASWTHEIAQAIVYTSPLLCYSGRPEDYLNNPAREIIKAIPATWDETIVLPGSEIGKVGAYARRKGDTWFIGVVNGDAAGTLPIDLKFLGKGDYQIEQFADTAERKDAYKASTNKVTRKDKFSIDLRANGGFIARLTKTSAK